MNKKWTMFFRRLINLYNDVTCQVECFVDKSRFGFLVLPFWFAERTQKLYFVTLSQPAHFAHNFTQRKER
tara:strand:- start:103 stop:312 length:210 start_codon:yes stop_codon:yes gene_type:complete